MIKKEIPLKVIVLFVLLVIIQLSSCYSPVDGCLDPEATNYDIDGDNDCLDCCTYPTLELSIFHENRDTTFKLNDTIKNDLDQQISLLDFAVLLSDFSLEVEGETHEIQDLVSLSGKDEPIIVKDDVLRVSRSVFTYEIGTIIYDGKTESMSFKIGLVDALNENRFTDEIDDHPLTTDPDSLFQEASGTYVFQRIKIAQGNDFLDTVIYDVTTAYDVSFPIDFESIRGEDKTIIIEAQYDRWFDGIDFNTMSQPEIMEKIGQNSINLFREKN